MSIDGPLQGSQEDKAAKGAGQTGQRWTIRFVLQGENYVSFSSDSNLVASGAGNLSTKLWDTDTGIARLIFVRLAHCCAFSPTEPLVTTGGVSGPIAVRDTASGITRHELKYDNNYVLSLDFSPDGRLLTTGTMRDGIVRVWDIAKGTLYLTLNTGDRRTCWHSGNRAATYA
jgi:WD40 repeat protein